MQYVLCPIGMPQFDYQVGSTGVNDFYIYLYAGYCQVIVVGNGDITVNPHPRCRRWWSVWDGDIGIVYILLKKCDWRVRLEGGTIKCELEDPCWLVGVALDPEYDVLAVAQVLCLVLVGNQASAKCSGDALLGAVKALGVILGINQSKYLGAG